MTEIKEKITVTELPITALRSFEEHPYKVVDNEEMASLVESIYTQGILTPLTVRPLDNGEYEIVSGHRRLYACQKLGIAAIPAIVKELSREDAILEMVDSNLHREHILPSEKAKAYKMKMDAIKRQGERTDLTLSPMATKSAIDSAAEIGSAAGESRDQVFRYIRLNLLIPELLNMVDEGRIAFRPAVELSHLQEQEQYDLLTTIESEDATPSLSQAIRLKRLSQDGKLNMDTIFDIMTEEKPNQKETVKIQREKLDKYFGRNVSVPQIEATILRLLENERIRQLKKRSEREDR